MTDQLDRSITASIGDIASRAPALGALSTSRRASVVARPRRAPVYAAATLALGAAALLSVIVLRSGADDTSSIPAADVPRLQPPTDVTDSAGTGSVVDAPTTAAPPTAAQPDPSVDASLIDGCLSRLPDGGTALDPTCAPGQTAPAEGVAFRNQLQQSVLDLEGYALYSVVDGDTLSQIAGKLDRPFEALLAANGGSANMIIYSGMPLLVPPLHTVDLTSAAEAPAGTVGVVSRATGALVGFVDESALGLNPTGIDDIDLPDIEGPAVRLPDGTITGYFVAGPAGFVDIAIADDTPAFIQLVACYASADAGVVPGPECDVPFLRQGVDPYTMARIAALNATLPDRTIPQPPVDHSRLPTAEDPTRVLLLGDNTVSGLIDPLQRLLDASGVATLSTDYESSSGLIRADFFDWSLHLSELLQTSDPDMVVVSIGSNDAQPFLGDASPVDSDHWRTFYTAKVREFMDAIERGGRTVIWVTAPIGPATASAALTIQNDTVLEQAAAHPDIQVFDAWTRFLGVDGTPSRDALDPRDGQVKPIRDAYCSLNTAGNEILATFIGQTLLADLETRGATIEDLSIPISTDDTTADDQLATSCTIASSTVTNSSVIEPPVTNSSVPG